MLRTSPVFVGLAISAVLLALLLRFSVNQQQPETETLQSKLWNTEELARHNGSDDGLPLLLGILGSVFDVTKGRSHYGPGGGYHHFAGRDASRAFVSGNFTGDGLTDSLHGLSSVEIKSIVDWRDFYFRSYIFVGKLVGRYYDNQGTPTKSLKGVEAKAARGAQLLEKQKIEEAKLPSCNSRWSQQEGGEVWCDTGYPRLVQRPLEMALTGKMSRRCACFKEAQLGQSGLEVYEGCAYLSQVELRVYKDEQEEDFPTRKRVQGRAKNCIRISRERVEKALQYSYRDRRNKKRDMRSLWIERINAGSRLHGVNYGNFVHGLMKENIQLNRKVLSELSMHEPYSFKALVDISRVAFPGNKKVPVLPQKEGLSLLV